MSAPTGKASFWSITINNPTNADYEQLELVKAQPWFKRFEGQLEKGNQEGTLHIQAYLETRYGRFLSKIREALPRAHVEVARKPKALINYVHKEQSRVAQLPKLETKVATQADLQNTMFDSLYYNGNYYWRTWIPAQDMFLHNYGNHKEHIRVLWEAILDDAVKELIEHGYYGIEFVVSNNQVRTAFKKYLPEIIFRTWMERQEKLRLEAINNNNEQSIDNAVEDNQTQSDTTQTQD